MRCLTWCKINEGILIKCWFVESSPFRIALADELWLNSESIVLAWFRIQYQRLSIPLLEIRLVDWRLIELGLVDWRFSKIAYIHRFSVIKDRFHIAHISLSLRCLKHHVTLFTHEVIDGLLLLRFWKSFYFILYFSMHLVNIHSSSIDGIEKHTVHSYTFCEVTLMVSMLGSEQMILATKQIFFTLRV